MKAGMRSFDLAQDRLPAIGNRKTNVLRPFVFFGLLGSLLLTTSPVADAQQQQTKVSKIGWLSARGAANIGQETIVGMLRDLGYVEGKNIAYEYRFADDKLDRIPALAEELVRVKRDVRVSPRLP